MLRAKKIPKPRVAIRYGTLEFLSKSTIRFKKYTSVRYGGTAKPTRHWYVLL